MTLLRSLLALMGVAGLAAAADPGLMNLVMPDASMVMEVNISKIMASPIGAAMRDAVHQGAATQLQGEALKSQPQFQELIAGLTHIDWSREVRDVVIASGPGAPRPIIMLVRTSLDPARIQAVKGFRGDASEFEGVPILASAKPGDMAFAFLDGGIVAIGPMRDVKSAIHRRGQHTALPKALAAQVAKYDGDDIWAASTEIPTVPLPGSPATKSPAGAKLAQFIEKVAGLNGGLRFSPDFDFSADLEMRTVKGAAELADGLRSLTAMVQSQAKIAGPGGSGLEAFKYRMDGKHVLLSLHVPEAQVRAGLQQMRAAQARQTVVASRQVQIPQQPRVAPSSGLPPPPAGTIRVQSSDMGTVLLPVGKPQ